MSELVQDWLRTKGVTLWANWHISEEDELAEAAEWFNKELQAFERFFMSRRFDIPNPAAVIHLDDKPRVGPMQATVPPRPVIRFVEPLGRWPEVWYPGLPLDIHHGPPKGPVLCPPPGVALNPLKENT